jgi:hypothetical protein
MKFQKAIILVMFAVIFSQCAATKFDSKPPFTITGATYNSWVGGQQGVSGIRLVFNYESKETIKFQKVYFANKVGSLEPREKDGKVFLTGHISTSTRRGKELVLDIDPKKEMKNELPEKTFPFELKENEAVISYLENGVTKFYKVKDIIKTKTDYYP